MRIGVISLGCPKNLVDSEVMLGLLLEAGHQLVDPDEAEVVIVNTCAFIRDAEREAEAVISEILENKGNRKLIVAGCLPQRRGEELLRRFPGIDALIGVNEFLRIDRIVEEVARDSKPLISISRPEALYDHLTPRALGTPPHYAYVKIAEGCSHACSFCVIPRIRGRYRSREFESVLAEAAALAESGVKEIILIAQDTTRYGIDLYGRPMIAELLRELARIEGLRWIRLLYSYPSRIDEELLRVIAEEEKICKYLDIPIQHINDEILRRMRREGGSEAVRRAVEMAREIAPDIALRSTVIVGFPGEREEHFEELLDFISEAEFDHLGVFIFSPEEGTPAAGMEDQVPDEVKRERYEAVVEVQTAISLRKKGKMAGKRVEAVVEGVDPETDMPCARAEFQAPEIDDLILIENLSREEAKGLKGKFVEVEITGLKGLDLLGRIRRGR